MIMKWKKKTTFLIFPGSFTCVPGFTFSIYLYISIVLLVFRNGSGTFASTGIAYGAQKAWLMNATLRDNILFGTPYNPGR